MNETTQLASRWKRLGGSLLDSLISIAVMVPIMFASGIFNQMKPGQKLSIEQSALFCFVGLAIFLIIHGYLLSKQGQTVGKKIAGTRIVAKENGRILPLSKVFTLRVLPISIINQIPLIGGLFGFVDALFIFRNDKRCVHDLIAGTVVVDVNQITNQSMERTVETPDD